MHSAMIIASLESHQPSKREREEKWMENAIHHNGALSLCLSFPCVSCCPTLTIVGRAGVTRDTPSVVALLARAVQQQDNGGTLFL